jgi:RNA polymerase sigma-70 factor (ECF subfamily)
VLPIGLLIGRTRNLSWIALAGIEQADEPRDVLAAARTGDRVAFESIMRQYERPVLATALRLLGNLADAQDASQEVFLKLYRGLGRVTSENIAGWLYRVTVNVCHDMRRRSPANPLDDLASPRCDPQGDLLEAERRELVLRSLRRLSERERQALVLRDLEGLSTAEVARAMGSAEATVRSHIANARLKMRAFVERSFRRRV